MDFEFSAEEQALIRDVRLFIENEASSSLRDEAHHHEYIYGGPEGRNFFRKFAAKGWLTPGWPREYGGLGATEMVTYIIMNELAHAGVPFRFAGAHMVGPSLLRFGSDAHKKKYLLPLSKGEIEFAIGYSEPGAGSDLMSLRMQAEDKGDHFLVNGQKTFNTHAKVADYHWLAVRTDPDVPSHKGISILIVDLQSPGITVRPMMTMAGGSTNEVYYDDVKVPKENLVGEKNSGSKYIMAALDFERMFPYGHYQRLFDQLVKFTRQRMVGGVPLCKDSLVRQKLAQLEIELDVLNLLYFQLAHILDGGRIPSYQSSMEKNFYAELAQRMTNAALEITGLYGQVRASDSRAVLGGLLDSFYRGSVAETIYGGTSEIQRNIIAQRGLGLPRVV